MSEFYRTYFYWLWSNLITDFDNEKYTFNISNNVDGVSSSIFEFGDYSSGKNSLWPELNLNMINKIELTSTKLDSLFEKNNIESKNIFMII